MFGQILLLILNVLFGFITVLLLARFFMQWSRVSFRNQVGQFVVDDRDIVTSFFRDLVPFLVENGYDWVCFTGTDRIRALLARVGFHGLPVASAEAARARDTGDRWGRYYDFDPVVILGKLDDPQGRWCGGSLAAAEAS